MSDLENLHPDVEAYHDDDDDDSSAMTYYCAGCREKHASGNGEVFLPCCDSAVCRTEFNGMMRYGWWHGRRCPSCEARLPTFMVLSAASRRLVPASFATTLAMNVLLCAASLVSWLISPMAPLAALLLIGYVALDVASVHVSIGTTCLNCLHVVSRLRAWGMSLAAMLPNASFPQVALLEMIPMHPEPLTVFCVVVVLVAVTLMGWIVWAQSVRPRIERLFKTQLQRRFSLYYNSEVMFS